jgi:hypothetical protein
MARLDHQLVRAEIRTQFRLLGFPGGYVHGDPLDEALLERGVEAVLDVMAATGQPRTVVGPPVIEAIASGYFPPRALSLLHEHGLPITRWLVDRRVSFVPADVDVNALRALEVIEANIGGLWEQTHPDRPLRRALDVLFTAKLIRLTGWIDDLTAGRIARRR